MQTHALTTPPGRRAMVLGPSLTDGSNRLIDEHIRRSTLPLSKGRIV